MARSKSSSTDNFAVDLLIYILILPFFVVAKIIVVILNLILNCGKKKKHKTGNYNAIASNHDTYCSKCGSKVSDNQNYCVNCGKELESYDSDYTDAELDNLELEDWQKEEVKNGNFDPLNFEEEDELEDDDYYEPGEE